MSTNGSQGSADHQQLQTLAKRHLLMHFTRHGSYEHGEVPVIARGDGCYLYDSNGKRFFDGLSGLFCTQIGYGFGEELGEAAKRQMEELPFYINWSYAHPAVDRAGGEDRRARPGRPEPCVLRVRRLRGQRVDHQAGQAVPPAARPPPPLQDDRPPDRLPRHHAGRAQPDRHRAAACAVRAADAWRPPRQQHEPLPAARGRDRGGVHRRAADRAARRDRAGGPRVGGRRVHGAGPELGRHVHAAQGLLPGRPRDLRRVRHPDGRRRGDLRVRPAGRLVRVGEVRHPPRPGHLRQGRRLGLRAAGRRADHRQGGGPVHGGHQHHQPRHHLRRPPGRLRRRLSRTSR